MSTSPGSLISALSTALVGVIFVGLAGGRTKPGLDFAESCPSRMDAGTKKIKQLNRAIRVMMAPPL
jgi:hypothetical protein